MSEETQAPQGITDAEIFDSTFAAVSYIYRSWNMKKGERRAYERVMRHLAESHPGSVAETTVAEAFAKFSQFFSHPAETLNCAPVGENDAPK